MSTTTEETNYIDRKEFMRQVGVGFGAIMLMQCLQSCGMAEIPDPNPNGGGGEKVDFTIDLNLAKYAALRNRGGFVVVTEYKVIVAQTNDGDFIAVSSVCTHEGATLTYQANNKIFKCPAHESEFDAEGKVLKDPAKTALKKYNVTVDDTAKTVRVFE
jgi:cytochrome b6-f complex iron-sulfur subunit